MKKVLVCGAGGFIGSHMAKRLYEEGHFVRAVDIKWDGYFEEPYYSEKITLDLREYQNCLKVTEGINYVYQFAADMGGIGYITKIGADIMHNSALININMLQAAVENKVKRFFWSSSACVYPEYKQRDPNIPPLKEEDAEPAAPDQFYGWEKLFTEKLCEAYKRDYGLSMRIARYHNIFGPYGTYDGGREKAPAALCRKVAMAKNPGEIEIWGDGKQTRSFLYIDDCIDGTIKLMESDYDRPLNIGSDRLVTIDELADIIIKISGKKLQKKYNFSAPQGVRGRNADLTMIKKILGWEPKVSLEEGLERTYRWIEQQLKKDTN
ncbi:MAG: NAD-dependent dehydratase [Thermoplasmata archaeon]|nr:MAG: NAD-dependent dehydratase [Thermoplasmata archaeon]RLF35587.1 MAG: NAD-dependent dehydratase [Thermoplasmata archaeon]